MGATEAPYVCAKGHTQDADLPPIRGTRARCHECYRQRKLRTSRSPKRREWVERNRDRMLGYQRKFYLRERYGLTLEEYDALLEEQGSVCAICSGPPRTFQFLVVDHDHKTGEVRGLLCQPCNVGLGQFEDDPGRLRRALEYMGHIC